VNKQYYGVSMAKLSNPMQDAPGCPLPLFLEGCSVGFPSPALFPSAFIYQLASHFKNVSLNHYVNLFIRMSFIDFYIDKYQKVKTRRGEVVSIPHNRTIMFRDHPA
jgi:hypothetical protein